MDLSDSSSSSNKSINTKFFEAVHANDLDEVKRCLSQGANVNCKNAVGATGAHVAIKYKCYAILQLLTGPEYGIVIDVIDPINVNLVTMACIMNDETSLEILINAGADINLTDSTGQTPLHYCVSKNSTMACQHLMVFSHLNVNAADDTLKWTPLHSASSQSRDFIVTLLCSRDDIDLNATDYEGNTAVSLACTKPENNKIVAYLIAKGCDINLRNFENNAPIDQACANESLESVKLLLLQSNLNRNITNKMSKRYLQIHGLSY